MNPKEISNLINKAKSNDKEAIEELLNHYEPKIEQTVDYFMDNYSIGILDREDLLQSGRLGIISNLHKNNFSINVKWYIINSIRFTIINEAMPVRFPAHLYGLFNVIDSVLSKTNLVSSRDIAQYINDNNLLYNIKVSAEQIENSFIFKSATYVDYLLFLKNEETFSSYRDDCLENFYILQDKIDNFIIRDQLETQMNKVLNKREIDILKLRLGWNNQIPMTLDRVAQIYGLSKSRIRQIEELAIRKLKHQYR